MSSENTSRYVLTHLLENNMKHMIHFVEKYDDVAEALRTTLLALSITGLILGLAPFIILMTLNGS